MNTVIEEEDPNDEESETHEEHDDKLPKGKMMRVIP